MSRIDLWDTSLPSTTEIKVEKEAEKPKRGRPKKNDLSAGKIRNRLFFV